MVSILSLTSKLVGEKGELARRSGRDSKFRRRPKLSADCREYDFGMERLQEASWLHPGCVQGIAARCRPSEHETLDESAPDLSTISRTRRLMDLETHQAVF